VGLIGVSLFAISFAFALVHSTKLQRFISISFALAICALLYKSTAYAGSIVPLSGVYTLGLAAPWLGLTVLLSSHDSQLMTSALGRKTVVSLISISHAICFYSLLEFYTRQGKNVGYFENLSLEGSWWWDIPFSPNHVFLLGTFIFPFFLLFSWNSISKESGGLFQQLKHRNRF
jgi:hypothetical protein